MAETREHDALGGHNIDVPQELAAEEELARITPPNAELLKLAAEHPPASEWFEGDEERPF